ncbi:uncharacterized protein LOC111032465 [Myzus persicae]|uniref:uncharacterized protein LOC111032465 n=1 Tax=Myzus persicae TaxID=13164 RepID=UPI000B93883B|nr:uncharacterized protein LOC111032465 [Myzus persicae]
MSSCYSGLQARIKLINPLAKFVPCSAHPLNLILNSSIKRLSDTRWSARDDACYSLNKNWSSIENALIKIGENEKEKPTIRCEANGILKILRSLETSFCVVVELFQSLINYDSDIRTDKDYENFKKNAIEKCGIVNFRNTQKRQKKIKKFSDDSSTQNIVTDFKVLRIFPYVDIALRILLCTPVTNCSTERSFSALKRIKSYLRSNIGEERLSALAIMNIESDITTTINYDDIIQKFAQDRARRKI